MHFFYAEEIKSNHVGVVDVQIFIQCILAHTTKKALHFDKNKKKFVNDIIHLFRYSSSPGLLRQLSRRGLR